MIIAYFTNQYPKVSHSFVRREILGLEKVGVVVHRFSIRNCEEQLVDDMDKMEFSKTRNIIEENPLKIIYSFICSIVSTPNKFLKTTLLMIRIGFKSDRGLLKHFAYLVEACVLSRWLQESKVEHLHAHFGTNSATVAMFSKMLCDIPFSFTVHGPEEFDKPEFIALNEKIKQCAFVVAISSFGRSQLYRWIGHEEWGKVKVVHCGLDTEFHNINIPPISDTKRLVCVGRLCEQKGQLLLIEAAAKLAREGNKFELILAGDGPMRQELERLVTLYKIESHVKITGWISSDQVRDELLRARALVLPSFAEGLPVVIMESMALKRPVLSTYVAGIPELVLPGKNGFLIPAGSVNTIRDALYHILNIPDDELNQLGEEARKRVLERHDINSEVKKLVAYFQASVNESNN